MIIGISGSRCVGKDAFFKILCTLNHNFKRYAFADALKYDLHSLLKKQFNIDIFKADSIQKEMIRPIMISYGYTWRNIDIDHWVKLVYNKIQKLDNHIVPVITDLRYENELNFLRKEYGKKLIHIHITRSDGVEPTQEELNSLAHIHYKADVHVQWGSNTCTDMYYIVKQVYTTHLQNEMENNEMENKELDK